MNYERIIIELLSRIQVLEEQVAFLMESHETGGKEKGDKKVSTEDIRQYICDLKVNAKEAGELSVILKAGDIHKALNLKNAMPQVCNAMRQAMNENDIILHTTPSGQSSTIEIEYKV